MLGLLTPRRRRLPVRTPSSPSLTQEEIDAINGEHKEDTGYTYARSYSYSATYPREYINPVVGYRHSLSNSGFEDDRTYFTRGRDFLIYLISSLLYFIYNSSYSIAANLIYALAYFTPLYYVFNSAKTASDISAIIGIVAQFISRVTQISYYCVKDFFLQTGYNSISLKNDVREAFWNALGYRYVQEEETEYDVQEVGENFVRRQAPILHRVETVSWPRRFFDSIVYVVTFGRYPARLANAGVVPPSRSYHRTSGFGNKGFLARCALKVFGIAYYIITAGFLYERLEPVHVVGVQTRHRSAILAREGEKKYRFRWGLASALLLALIALMLFFGFAQRNSESATQPSDETHYPSLHLTESLRPTVELAYTKGLDATDYVVESGSNLIKAGSSFWSRFSSNFLASFDTSRQSAQNKTAVFLDNATVWTTYGFGKVLAIPRLLVDLVVALFNNILLLLYKIGEAVVGLVRGVKDVLLRITFAILNFLYDFVFHISQKIGFAYDSVPSVDTVAIVNNVHKNFGAVVGKNGYLSILWEQFVALLLYIALQLWNVFSYIVLLPYNLFGSEGYISQIWRYVFSGVGFAGESVAGAARYVFATAYYILSRPIAVINEARQQVVYQNELKETVKHVAVPHGIDDEDFETRVLAIMKKHYATLSPPIENTVIHFNDETLHNRIFPAISQYVTANPKFLESAFKKYLEANPVKAAPEKFDIDAKISSIVARDHKNQKALVEAAIQKYLSVHVAQIVSDYHANNPSYLAELIKSHLTANPLIKEDELTQKIEAIVKNESVIKVALSEQLKKLQSAVTSPSYNNTSGLSVAYLDNRLTELYTLFDAKLRNYSYDRTGEADYALESSGGFVVSTRCTEEYDASTRRESIFGIPLWYTQYSPRYVIQRPSASINAGECWAVKGQTAFLVVQLARPIHVASISYEHLPKTLSPDGNIDSAPKKFKVWSLQNEKDPEKVLIGHYYYDENAEALQKFTAVNTDPRGTPMIEFELTENYGAPYTCIYRLRVHGTPL
uniref:SUN domain-containing protein n=1 Tax=Panagrellus redivivus TaxID=6233 RepID=A0A7E4UU99_PANRE